MKRYLPLTAAAAALLSCEAEPAAEKQGANASPAAAEATAAAQPRKVEEKSKLLEFTYSWPAEAAAIPGLNKQFEEELGRDRVEAAGAAKEDSEGRAADGSDFFAHSFSKEWTVAGNTPRLLSLRGEVSTFTGGAHPNSDYDAIIWDREANRRIALADLFTSNEQTMAALSSRYCEGLDAERTKRRGEALPPSPDDFMTGCPAFADQTVVPVDTNGNGRFDLLQLLLAPSVAGPYAEGGYEVDLKLDAATLAALKPEYRAAFES